MPKPNYAFEKRQRELAKKKKKEEKLRQKQGARPPEDEPRQDGATPASGESREG